MLNCKVRLSLIRYLPVILIFLILGASRFALTICGMHHDLLTNAGWGEWISKQGPYGFYENNIWIYSWPTQLPLINLIYGFNYYLYQQLSTFFANAGVFIAIHRLAPTYMLWFFNFSKWFNSSLFGVTHYPIGFLISMKILPIIADLMISGFIYLMALRLKYAKPLLLPLLFLLLPFSWYTSAVWGQYDQFAALCLLISLFLLYKRNFLLSALFIFISFEVKPTVVVFTPFFFFYFFFQKPNIINLITTLSGLLAAFYLTTNPFVTSSIVPYTMNIIYPKVFNSDRYGLVNHAFNFWQLLAPFGGWSTTFFLLKIPALWWGSIAIAIFNFWGILLVVRKNNFQNLIIAAYIIAAGSYIFGVGMVDRYLFPATLFLGLLVIYQPKVLIWWVITLLLFSANLFYSWGYPILTDLTSWKDANIIRLFSFAQMATFIICLQKLHVFHIFVDSLNKVRSKSY